jgi:hypothetical protein
MKVLSNIDLSGVSRLVNVPTPVSAGDVVTKSFMDDQINKALLGFDFQRDVKGIQADDTLNPGTPAVGDRYIITNISSLHASFGSISGLGANDIVEYNGSEFTVVFDVSTKEDGVLIFNQADDQYYKYVAGNWSYGGMSVVTAGSGLEDTGGTFNVKYDNVTIGLNASGQLEVKASGTSTRKYSAPIGDGVATNITVNHNLGSQDVIVQVVDAVSYATVNADVARPDGNTVSLSFAIAPTANQYKVIVVG